MKISVKILKGFLTVLLTLGLIACEDYLDKTPSSNLTEEQVFGNYKNFEGFVDIFYGDNLIHYAGHALT